jgi:hypothetical protein
MAEERRRGENSKNHHNTRKRKHQRHQSIANFYTNDEESGRAERPADMITRTLI